MSAAYRAVAVLVAALVTAPTVVLTVREAARAGAEEQRVVPSAFSATTAEPPTDPETTVTDSTVTDSTVTDSTVTDSTVTDSPPPEPERGPLGLDPDRAVVGVVVRAAPCQRLPGDEGTFKLLLDGETLPEVGQQAAHYVPGRPTSFVVPDDAPAGLHSVETVLTPTRPNIFAASRAAGACDPTPFTVLAAPSLVLDPPRARASSEVTASGTCRPSPNRAVASLSLDGVEVVTTAIRASGEFGPAVFTVPPGTAPGSRTVTTDCGGTASLEVLASPVPTTTITHPTSGPTGPRTSAGPIVRPPGSASPVPSQSALPAPSSVAPTGAPTSTPVVQEPPVTRVSQPSPVLPAAALLGAAVLATTAARGLRKRRARQWVNAHVEVRPAARQVLQPVAGPPPQVTACRIGLRADPGAGWVLREEVQDAGRRDHAADDAPGAALR